MVTNAPAPAQEQQKFSPSDRAGLRARPVDCLVEEREVMRALPARELMRTGGRPLGEDK